MDAVKEPGSQPAWQASRPIPYRQSECSPVHVEASQCRAEAVSISLWCYSPFIAPRGPRRSKYVTFALFFFKTFFFSFKVFLHVMLSTRCQVSATRAERKPLTGVGHFILVCNIVCVPIAALYHVYRLLKDEKCIGNVTSRYSKA